MHQHEIAENLFSEAAHMRTQTLGSDHLDVAASLSKLGSTRVALQKFDAAFADLRRACKIARNALGSHKTVAQILSHLACLYYEANEMFASLATFEDALDIYRQVWKDEDDRDGCMMQLTDTLCNIGSIHNRRKMYRNAIEAFSEALDLQRGILPLNHPRILSTLDNLGYSHSKNKDYASALSCYKGMLRAQLSGNDSFNEDCYETFRKEILMMEKLKRIPEAADETKYVLRLQKSASTLRNQKIYAETKQLYEDLTKKLKRGEKEALSPP